MFASIRWDIGHTARSRRWTPSSGVVSGARRCFQAHELTRRRRHYAHTSKPLIISRTDVVAWHSNRYESFRNGIPRPRLGDVAAWIALLDQALPSHLRLNNDDRLAPGLAIENAADIILAAQYPLGISESDAHALDLLNHMATTQGRWSAVTWLIKALVDAFPLKPSWNKSLHDISPHWQSRQSLHDLTNNAINLARPALPTVMPSSNTFAMPLSDLSLTTERHDPAPTETGSHRKSLTHDVFGQIWRSIGMMTQACLGQAVRPEILEIIAHLHHKEIMPQSIYRYTPHPDPSAVQQPPLLPMLSSRVLTSLTDAAWRAHEREIIEQNAVQNGSMPLSGPEIPGSVYRVSVAGLRTEVWMELILWSCLHGGWTLQGAEVLRALSRKKSADGKPMWSATSWREHAARSAPGSEELGRHWSRLDYLFSTTASSSRDEVPLDDFLIDGTLSSELVNAYIDVIIESAPLPSEDSTNFRLRIIDHLAVFQDLLRTSDMVPSVGSWDALLLRLISSQDLDTDDSPGLLDRALAIHPSMGERTNAQHLRTLPDYVLAGSASTQSFHHRMLRRRVAGGDFNMALEAFQTLQKFNDRDKMEALSSFFSDQKLGPKSEAIDMFNSNISSTPLAIEYPTLTSSIPEQLTARLLHLAVENKAYDFARWMINGDDIDPPIISPKTYRVEAVLGALAHFAAATNDKELLKRLFSSRVNNRAAVNVLGVQLSLHRWDVAESILANWRLGIATPECVQALAAVGKEMLSLISRSSSAEKQTDHDLRRVRQLLLTLLRSLHQNERVSAQVSGMLSILAAAHPQLAQACVPYLPDHAYLEVMLPSNLFKTILEGVTGGLGGTAGRQLLDTFRPPQQLDVAQEGHRTTQRQGRNTPQDSYRIEIPLHDNPRGNLVCSGRLHVNTSMIKVVYEKALHEIAAQRNTARDDKSVKTDQTILSWAVQSLHAFAGYDPGKYDDLERALSHYGFEDLLSYLPDIIEEVETFIPFTKDDTTQRKPHG